MMESSGDEPASALFARVAQLASERGTDIRRHLDGNVLRLEFPDGQRIVINVDPHTHGVWVAARSGGIEFVHRDDSWHAQDGRELVDTLRKLIEQTIASDPLNARAAEPMAAQPIRPVPLPQQSERRPHRLRDLVMLMLAATAGFWVALQLSAPPPAPSPSPAGTAPAQEPSPAARPAPAAQLQCEGGFPPNGSVTLFPENGARPTGPNDPEVTLRNDHAHPLLLILAVPQTVIPVMSVLIHARQNASVRVPPGQYDTLFAVGNTWCNPRTGFSDGHILKFEKPLVVQMDRPMQLTMQTSGAGMEDFQLFVKVARPETEIPPPTFAGDGSMEVQRHPNGHFYVPGSVGGVPVTFMVDTGASVTSISDDVARRAGIRNCKEVPIQTANGATTGCIALVPHMTLGNFVMENITVAVMPNMEVNLLGANVLRNFQVSQSDSVMLIGRR